jgi:Na+/proline symporter
LLALQPGQVVAMLGIFAWGLFASTLVPSLAIGLNWPGATRSGAISSMSVGLVVTLLFESLGQLNVYVLPTGVTGTGLALVLSLLTFFTVSWFTRDRAASELDADVRLVMES